MTECTIFPHCKLDNGHAGWCQRTTDQPITDMVIPPVLAAEVEPWLQECGSCDYGLMTGCVCPQGDYRVILLKVWRAYEAQVAETKALTETATELGRRIGRAEAGEEIAQALESRDSVEWVLAGSYSGIDAAHIARTIGTNPTPLPAGAVSDAHSGTTESPKLSEDAEAVRSPQEDA